MAPLFFIGIIEMLIVTAWTKYVTKTKILASGTITVVNVLIWYYVLGKIVNDISNFGLVVVYAIGCAFGTMLATYYFGRRKRVDDITASPEFEVGPQTYYGRRRLGVAAPTYVMDSCCWGGFVFGPVPPFGGTGF
jgi:purine-cytosine permease-like protein